MFFKRKKGRLLNRVLPVLVWSASLVFVVLLFKEQSQRFELKGIAFSYEQTINSSEAGYITSLPVHLYEGVKKGDTIAVLKMNTESRNEYLQELLKAQQRTARAELQRLNAELAATEQRLDDQQSQRKESTASQVRRLALDVERARLEILEVKTVLEPDKMLLENLSLEVKIAEHLLEEKAIDKYEVDQAKAQYNVLNEKVMKNEELLAQAQDNYEKAKVRKDEFMKNIPVKPWSTDKALEPIKKAILVQERRIKELMQERDLIVLTAPFDGIIQNMNCKSGQAVVRGEPIMTIIKPIPESIVTWIPQQKAKDIKVSTKVQVVSLNTAKQTFEGEISHLSPAMEVVPQRLWWNPDIPEWGQVAKITVHPGFSVIPNEMVGIKILAD